MIAITSVTLAELLVGVRRLPSDRRKVGLTRRIDAALEPYRGSRAVLPFDDVAVDRYADVLVSRENAGGADQYSRRADRRDLPGARSDLRDTQREGLRVHRRRPTRPWSADG